MCEFSNPPVEIWHQILFAFIDVPFILDTTIDPKRCYWGQQHLYHDEQAYRYSERRRCLLRLVCQTWRAFADRHKCRWIIYDSREDYRSWRYREAAQVVEAARSDLHRPAIKYENGIPLSPKRFRITLRSHGDLWHLQSVLGCFAQKLTTLCVNTSSVYPDSVFSIITNHSSSLPNLRDLTFPQPRAHLGPLQSLSNTFPKLISLDMSNFDGISLFSNDVVTLQNLESLRLDLPSLDPVQAEGWEVPALLRLVVQVYTIGSPNDKILSLLRLNGFHLVFLQFLRQPIGRLPDEFWAWCPALTEFAASLSRLDLGSPVPPGHPLKQIIHFPNPRFIDVDVTEDNLLWRNIDLLPYGLQSFIFSTLGGWVGYSERLDSMYRPNVAERYFRRMNLACTARSIIALDDSNVALSKVLEEYSWETGME